MIDPWATDERARCVTELAALKQGGHIRYDDGSGEREVTAEYIARLEKWIEFLDGVIEDDQQRLQS